ncbi:hypothetical protein MKX03_002466 [Papaver bracteatum]|nr:hypothetical protein MKX03_002466 [Papaver bracteatum]
MGIPPCCDKVGIKKGPWTPEEDIILVSYIQQNGPGNWRLVPTNTALNPPPPPLHQVIASNSTIFAHQHHDLCYTDKSDDQSTTNPSLLLDHHIMINHGITTTSGGGATYASSTENISRLLEGWVRSSPKLNSNKKYILPNTSPPKEEDTGNKLYYHEQESCDIISSSHEDFDSLLSFENMNCNIPWEKLSTSSNDIDLDEKMRSFPEINTIQNLMENGQQQPLRLFEKWLLDEAAI